MSVLEVRSLTAGYGRIRIIHEMDFAIEAGQVVAVVGPNGAGKTTLLCAISSLARVFEGSIRLDGADLGGVDPAGVAARGVAHVPENRLVFGKQSVVENLLLGAYTRRRERRAVGARVEEMLSAFPKLAARRAAPAGTLSGGEQQMLAIAMALMSEPRLLMLDEPSLGLAPLVIDAVYEHVTRLKKAGTTMLLVEQNVDRALAVADHALVLHLGRVISSGSPSDVLASGVVENAYQLLSTEAGS